MTAPKNNARAEQTWHMLHLGHYWCRAEREGLKCQKRLESRSMFSGTWPMAHACRNFALQHRMWRSDGAQMIDQLVEGSNNNHKWRLVLTVAKKKKQGNRQGIRDRTRKRWYQFEFDQWTLSVLIFQNQRYFQFRDLNLKLKTTLSI